MKNQLKTGETGLAMAKGALLALAISLLATIAFAVILRTTSWGERMIYPINQGIKCVAITVGAFVFVRGERGWLQGGGIGLIFTAISYLAFSSFGGDFSLSWLIVAELSLAFLFGAISGALAVNVKRGE